MTKDSDASLRGRIAACERWARIKDRTLATEPARAGLDAKFAAQVDPDRRLDPADRAKRVSALRRAHFARLARLSADSRRRSGAARKDVVTAEAGEYGPKSAVELHKLANEVESPSGES
jgi:hypothetical protein